MDATPDNGIATVTVTVVLDVQLSIIIIDR